MEGVDVGDAVDSGSVLAFVPVLAVLACGLGIDVDVEGVGDAVDSVSMLALVPVLAVDELPVFWLQVTGFTVLSSTTLKVPLMA